ncbi:DUF7133 domain-containing protein [Roseibacillus ishigakijimensis]|uniref:C-type cytochrome n=1 Tax=Roseibacillus ishigakijimensis TaxID=454146 RepID=A0A934VM93_9BACT|nr:HEAT repeat domain-containing protein [Roseibacillus ishigakijimensis]MBK1833705.1 c-type cytochrome [Roseibacillus ishigakijimensis]
MTSLSCSLSLSTTLCTTLLAADLGHVPAEENASIQVPRGLTLKLFADESQVTNPTTLCLDDENRVYVGESHRWRIQVQDIRDGGKFLKERVEDDIRCWTTDDRMAYHKKWSSPQFLEWKDFTREAEKIRLLTDHDGDGRADESGYFRDDFNDPLSGTAGGLMERDGTVYFANIPGIYALRDLDGDGQAEEVKTLVDGFGCRVSFSGHDLNGFAFGPDGKLYWTIGDRGYHVEQEGRVFAGGDTGAVFRAFPDGSHFEVVHKRLRNPKEIVFDAFGNLFTADNDYDQGDSERIVYVVPHGDSGWHMGHQTQTSFGTAVFKHRKPQSNDLAQREDPWMAEGLWKPRHEGQPAYLLPPVALTVNGPGGLAYNPGGVALPKQFDRSFFLTSYVGSTANCKVETFRLNAAGGGFALESSEPFVKSLAATDLDWGTDGRLYLCDYIGGWGQPEKGRIWTLADEDVRQSSHVQETARLLQGDFSALSPARLLELLAFDDQRVRQRAQFALAQLPAAEARKRFAQGIQAEEPFFRRLHSLWGLGQLAFAEPEALADLAGLLHDEEEEMRANAARALGWHPRGMAPHRVRLQQLLQADSPRVASLAAFALANEGHPSSLAPALALLRKNADQDLYLRHGGIVILAESATPDQLAKLANDESRSVRLAAVVALRRQGAGEIAHFFEDSDQAVRQEAIRGAYDEHIVAALPALADRVGEVVGRVGSGDHFYPLTAKRAIYAAWRTGRAQDVAALARIAADWGLDARPRRDALVALLDWNEPPVADPVTGTAVPLGEQREPLTAEQLAFLPDYLARAAKDPAGEEMLPLALLLAEETGRIIAGEVLQNILQKADYGLRARLTAGRLLVAQSEEEAQIQNTLAALLASPHSELRSFARESLLKTDRETALGLLAEALTNESSTVPEQQMTLRILGEEKGAAAAQALTQTIARLQAGTLPKALVLDVLQAAEKSSEPTVAQALAAYRASLPTDDPWAEWFAACEEGGDRQRGEEIYLNHGAAQCARCHVMDGIGGQVGPELSTIGKSRDRAYLLRSLLTPGSEVAEGFGVVTVTLQDGSTVSGIKLAGNEDGAVVIQVGEEKKVIPREKVAGETEPVSAMPPMGGLLDQGQIRDVVAYLASRQEDQADEKNK